MFPPAAREVLRGISSLPSRLPSSIHPTTLVRAAFSMLSIPSDSGNPPSVQVWALPATGRAETALFPSDCIDTSPPPTSLLARPPLLSSRLLSGRHRQRRGALWAPPRRRPKQPPGQMALGPPRRCPDAARDAAQERATVPRAVSSTQPPPGAPMAWPPFLRPACGPSSQSPSPL